MLKLSTKSRYGVRVMSELARQGGEKEPVMMRKLAERQGISKRYLDNIFATLRQSGLVVTERGALGGYMLARAAETITVLDVVEALDGPVTLVPCVNDDGSACSRKPGCRANKLWSGVSSALKTALASVTIADLIDEDIANCSLC